MIKLERIERWPRLKRPDGWVPEFGERVWYARGGRHPSEIVRVGLVMRGGCYPIAVRMGTHGAMLHGDAPLSRLWPLLGWEQERERRRREDGEDGETGRGGDGEMVLTGTR